MERTPTEGEAPSEPGGARRSRATVYRFYRLLYAPRPSEQIQTDDERDCSKYRATLYDSCLSFDYRKGRSDLHDRRKLVSSSANFSDFLHSASPGRPEVFGGWRSFLRQGCLKVCLFYFFVILIDLN
jgi:hypothetical protein